MGGGLAVAGNGRRAAAALDLAALVVTLAVMTWCVAIMLDAPQMETWLTTTQRASQARPDVEQLLRVAKRERELVGIVNNCAAGN